MKTIPIKKIIQETPDTISLVLDVPPYSWDYKAGQHITIGVTIAGERYYRSYSFATSPYQDAQPAITIKRVKGGKVSNYLHDHIQVGSHLDCSGPQGNFTIDSQLYEKSYFCFIAGGSGITPLFAMIKTTLQQNPKAHLQLIYANKDEFSIIYQKALAKLAQAYPAQLKIIHILSQPKQASKAHKGRLTPGMLRTLLQNKYTSYHYFLCGPTGLMDLAKATLIAVGVDDKHIHSESFITPTAKSSPVSLIDQDQLGCDAIGTIHYQGDIYTCDIAQGETLLDAALDQGIDIPYSCSSGMCNMCRVKCIAGKVHMLEDAGLSEAEKQENYVLTCVGYPATAKVTIAIEDE